jgi:hypothetical protein
MLSDMQSKDQTCTFSARKIERNGGRIISIDRPLWQNSNFRMLRQRLYHGWKILEILKRWDR